MSDVPSARTRRCGARPAFWVGLAAAAALVVGFQVFRPRRLPPLEVERSQLILRGDRLCRRGEAQPFSGAMVEHYPNGSLQSRSRIVQGVLHGVSEGWHTNGQLQVREYFHRGVSQGRRIKWHANGRKLSEAVIVKGKLEGVFLRWHENGVVAERVEMRDGQPDGMSEAFYPSGFLKARATVRAGRLLSQEHWPDGERKADPNLARTN